MNIKVSIVVPAFNAEDTINRCVQSIQRQSLKEIEIIIVNDGSTDNTSLICKASADNDKRIKVINKQNEGLSLARNTGIDCCSGEYIGFVDADDRVDEEYFSELYSAAITQDGRRADISVGGCTDWYVESNSYSVAVDCFAGKKLSGDDIRRLYVPTIIRTDEKNTIYNGCSVWKCLYRKETIDKNNIRFYSERSILSEDVLFNLQVLEHAELMTVCDAVGYYYAQMKGTLSKRYRPHFLKAIKELYIVEKTLLFKNDSEIQRKYSLGYIANLITGCIDEVASEQPYTSKLKHITDAINDFETINAMTDIAINNIRIEKRAFYFALKYRSKYLMLLLCKMRNCIRG